jgi:hypothetical protein
VRTHSRGFPTRPRERAACRLPVMTVARRISGTLILRASGSGIWIASLLSPAFVAFPCSTYRTLLEPSLREWPSARVCSLSLSDDRRSSIRSGSSSSASRSPISPVSPRKEKSDPAESNECRRPLESSSLSLSSESSSDWRRVGISVRRGMLEDLDGLEGGIVPVFVDAV